MKCLKFFAACMLSLSLVFVSVPQVFADETSELILKLLIKKGIITQGEVDALMKEAKKVPAESKTLVDRVATLEKKTPQWIEDFKLKGDLRLRNDSEWSDPGADNNQQRIRFRLGGTTNVNDKVKLGFGLATGGTGNATSTNQTLDGSFGTYAFDLDYAYAKYNPYDWMYLIGGKFKSPFFHTDLLWDSDIRFDGVAGKITHDLDLSNPTQIFLSGGAFPMEDTATARDLHLFVTQIGSTTKFGDSGYKLKTGLANYNFRSIEGATTGTLTGERMTNSYVGTALRHDFRVISPTVKLYAPDIIGLVDIPAGLLGEFAHNYGADDANEAWRLGAWIGQAKVKKKGQWRLLTQYSQLERDSFVDIFPDADFNDAGTNAKGWETIFDYGLADHVIFSLDYYNTQVNDGAKSDDEKLQVDLMFKF